MMLQVVKPRTVVRLRTCLFNHTNQSTIIRSVRSFVQLHNNQDCQLNKIGNEGLKIDQLKQKNYLIDFSAIQKFKTNQPNRSSADQTSPTKESTDGQIDSNKPSKNELDIFYKYLETSVPKFFRQKIDSSFFVEDVQLEDNQSGIPKVTIGFDDLFKKVVYIRLYYSLFYAFNQMNVLSMAKLPDEGMVKVRWRITSQGRLFIFLQFWRLREFQRKEYFNDGIAYFYLNGNGKVYRVTLEKIEKDKQENLLEVPLQKVAKI